MLDNPPLQEKMWKIKSFKRIYRLLDQIGLKARIRRRRRWFGKTESGIVVAPNILNRNFKATRPNQRWVTDITYLPSPDKIHYLSAIKDLATQEIVAYHISDRNDLRLVLETLIKAIKRQKKKVHGILIHSDQGFQYTSKQYQNLLQQYGMISSMSRKGNCLDNAAMENFFSHLKV